MIRLFYTIMRRGYYYSHNTRSMAQDKILAKLKTHDKEFTTLKKQFKEMKIVQDKIIEKLIEHDDRLDRIEKKIEGLPTAEMFSSLMVTLDTIVGMFKIEQTERMAIINAIRRHEDRIETVEEDTQKIKSYLQLA